MTFDFIIVLVGALAFRPAETSRILHEATRVVEAVSRCESLIFEEATVFSGIRLRFSADIQVTLRKTADGEVEASVIRVERGLDSEVRRILAQDPDVEDHELCNAVRVRRWILLSSQKPMIKKLYRRLQRLKLPLAIDDEEIVLHADIFRLWVRSGLLDVHLKWYGQRSHPLTGWSERLLEAVNE